MRQQSPATLDKALNRNDADDNGALTQGTRVPVTYATVLEEPCWFGMRGYLDDVVFLM